MNLPVIELTIDDILENRVEAIAFVDNPAIQRNWMAFNDHKEFKFQTQDEEKRIVAGALMVADMPIYRNMGGKEFFVKFTAETIEQIVNKFMKEGRINAFNFMHNEQEVLDGVYIQQAFIINSKMGMNVPTGFDALADGSWFGFIRVENDLIWNDFVKTGKLKGFSVEGSFSEKQKFTSNIMTKVEQFLEKLAAKFGMTEEEQKTEEKQYGSATLAGGGVVKWEGELAVGSPVFIEDGSPAPDGQHTFEDGTVILVEGGIVAELKAPEEVAEVEMQDEPQPAKFEQEVFAAIKELNDKIAAIQIPDYTERFAAIEKTHSDLSEAQKLLFETIKAFADEKQPESAKDKFRRAERKAMQLSDKAEAYLNMNKK